VVFCKPKLIQQEAERQSAHEIAGHFVVEEVVAGGAACVSGLVRLLCVRRERERMGETERELARSRVRARQRTGWEAEFETRALPIPVGAIGVRSSVTVTHMHQVQVGDHLISVDNTPIGLSHGAPSNPHIALHDLPSL
jgi:hypothetical protein